MKLFYLLYRYILLFVYLFYIRIGSSRVLRFSGTRNKIKKNFFRFFLIEIENLKKGIPYFLKFFRWTEFFAAPAPVDRPPVFYVLGKKGPIQSTSTRYKTHVPFSTCFN